jgi:hypothetical protein
METPKTRGQSRRQRALNDLKLLSVVLSRHGPSSTKTVRSWGFLRRLPQRELAWYRISCKACASTNVLLAPQVSNGFTHAWFRPIEVTNLSSNCTVCDIIQQVCKHFSENVDSRHQITRIECDDIFRRLDICIDVVDSFGTYSYVNAYYGGLAEQTQHFSRSYIGSIRAEDYQLDR